MSLRKNQNKNRVIYFSDEKNDEFSGADITPRAIDASYKYDRSSFFYSIARFFWYRMVAVPIAYCYLKIVLGHKIARTEGREALARSGACFVYGNHTQIIGDALMPTFINAMRDAYVVVHPDNVSMRFLGRLTPYMGAIPLPDDMDAMRNFCAILKKRIEQKKAIFIYPEAHIWPYYTGIRGFGDESFIYPVKYGTPVFCFTNTYQKRGKRSRPRVVSYIDGPFVPDTSLAPRERRKKLCEDVYRTMLERSKLSDVEWIKYIKTENGEEK